MYDIHIEEFFLDCKKILQQIYQAFPKNTNIYVEDISGPDQADEYGLHSDRFQSCFGAMLWLEHEHFIRFESTMRQEAIDQANLSSKGLRMMSSICHDEYMNKLSDTIKPRVDGLKGRPNIDTLNHIHQHGTSSQLALAVQYLFQKYA